MTTRPGGLGVAAALAAGMAGCGDGRAPMEPPVTYELTASGRVHTVDGTVPHGLIVRIAAAAGTAAATVAADGSFVVQATVSGDTVDLVIDVGAGMPRSTLPSLIRVPSRSAVAVSAVLVPARWTISGGSYDGQTVDISLDAAFRAPCSTAGDINCDGFFPAAWHGGIKMWPLAAYPVPVALDRTRSHAQITAADSAEFWGIVHRMHDDIGTVTFRPARLADLTLAADGRPLDAIVIRVDTTLTGFGAWTNWWWDAGGNMYAAVVRTATLARLRSGPLMTHELLHTQGFKHSCSWTTVMGGYGCGSSNRLSAADVAHAQLARRVRETQRSAGAAHGLTAALQGERVVLAGLPRLTNVSAARARLMYGDSISHDDHPH
jgi:hypothetical protein